MRFARKHWVERIPRRELNVLHHALRLVAQHPKVVGEQRAQVEQLADVLWNESTRRTDERVSA